MTLKIKSKDPLGLTLLRIELTAKKVKMYPSFGSNFLTVSSNDTLRVRNILKGLKSPRKLSFELNEIHDNY